MMHRWVAFKEALKSRARAAAVRHFALSERAKTYLAQGKKAQAWTDVANAPGYRRRVHA
jgi:hypothetical protein